MLHYIDHRQVPAIFRGQRSLHFQYLCGCERELLHIPFTEGGIDLLEEREQIEEGQERDKMPVNLSKQSFSLLWCEKRLAVVLDIVHLNNFAYILLARSRFVKSS